MIRCFLQVRSFGPEVLATSHVKADHKSGKKVKLSNMTGNLTGQRDCPGPLHAYVPPLTGPNDPEVCRLTSGTRCKVRVLADFSATVAETTGTVC